MFTGLVFNAKQLIKNNTSTLRMLRIYQVEHATALEQSKKLNGGARMMMEAEAALVEVPIARYNFFMSKIDKIKATKSDIN